MTNFLISILIFQVFRTQNIACLLDFHVVGVKNYDPGLKVLQSELHRTFYDWQLKPQNVLEFWGLRLRCLVVHVHTG